MSHVIDKYYNQENIAIYNNIGEYNGKSGRLTINCSLAGSPRIEWEFQSLTNYINGLDVYFNKKSLELTGVKCELENVMSTSYSDTSGRGFAGVVRIGDHGERYQAWSLFYVNLKCESHNDLRKNWEWHYDSSGGLKEFACTRVQVRLNSGWKLTASTPKYAKDALTSREGRDFRITSFITLENTKLKLGKTYNEMLPRFRAVTFLLQFASGGYTFPVVAEAINLRGGQVSNTSTFYSSGTASRLDEFNTTWFGRLSDIALLLKNMDRITKMQDKYEVFEELSVCMMWYIQSLQTNRLPIVANSLGAGIEKLAYIYLVKVAGTVSESEWTTKTGLDSRIILLCRHLGIRNIVNAKAVVNFMHVRNSATHAKVINSNIDKAEAIREVLFIFEEAMLSLCGYSGSYLNRTTGAEEVAPMYKILQI